MVFITTGQRIATENFADGVIYKVTFVDTTISYMMCVGIGQDFVMLQGPNPSLFCLTMSSASRVSTIDVHDPTPPEPPTPIENALQYQTGEPPFTFTTTESSLFSWYIEGPCGVKTANLCNISEWKNTSLTDTRPTLQLKIELYNDNTLLNSKYKNVNETGEFNVTTNATEDIITKLSFKHSGWTRDILLFDIVGNWEAGTIFTFSANCLGNNPTEIDGIDLRNIMLNLGSTALPYEPYGKYKISILSNDNAETIYFDEALAEGERLYSVNIDTVVVTDIGENTLSVTPTPPEMQIVYGIYAEA